MFKTLKRKLYNFLWLVTCFRRNRYLKKLRKRLKNQNPTIITSDCVGGIVYHDLNLPFTSPTINMRIESPDFIIFLEHLREFINITPEKVIAPEITHPVGELKYKDLKVTLHFVHYKTFEEALQKWEERKKRINFDNIFVIWQVANKYGPSKELLERFLKINYNKVLITGKKCSANNKEIVKLKFYENPPAWTILSYKRELISNKRYLNKFDFVTFLNSGKVKQ